MERKGMAVLNLFVAVLLLAAVSPVYGEEYEGLASLKSAKIVFDEREASPQGAAVHLKLMHQTYKDLGAMKKDPAIAVVFIGPSVKLISKNRDGFSPEDQKTLDEIAATISAMAKDGIKTEMCLVAARYFKVDPASVLPEIKHVGNGWISMLAYQSRGYSLVPVY